MAFITDDPGLLDELTPDNKNGSERNKDPIPGGGHVVLIGGPAYQRPTHKFDPRVSADCMHEHMETGEGTFPSVACIGAGLICAFTGAPPAYVLGYVTCLRAVMRFCAVAR